MLLRSIHFTFSSLLWAACGLVIGLACSLLLMRFAWPLLPDYQAYLTDWLRAEFGQAVTFDAIDTEWTVYGPAIALRQATISGVGESRVPLRVKDAYFVLDVYESLRQREPVPYALELEGITWSRPLALPALSTGDGTLWSGRWARFLMRMAERGGLSIRDLRVPVTLPGGEHLSANVREFNLTQQRGLHYANLAVDLSDGIEVAELELITNWSGTFEQVRSGMLPFYFNLRQMPLAWLNRADSVWQWSGTASLEGWYSVGLQDYRRALGSLEIRSARAEHGGSGQVMTLAALDGNWQAIQSSDGWTARIDEARLHGVSGVWPRPIRAFAHYRPDTGFMHVGGNFVRLDDLRVPEAVGKAWFENPELTHIASHIRGDVLDWQAVLGPACTPERVTGTVEQLGWAARDKMPGFDGLGGTLLYQNDELLLDLNSGDVTLYAPRLFRQPLRVHSLTGRATLRPMASGWQLLAERIAVQDGNLDAVARMQVLLSAEHAPFLDLKVAFDGRDARSVPTYLPTGIMRERVVQWLDSAFLGGRTEQGSAIFHGLTSDFPFNGAEGVFEVVSDFDDLELNFNDQWPNLVEAHGQMRFRNRSMSISANRGRILGSDVSRVDATIDDFRQAELRIHGTANGATRHLLRFLTETPLQTRYGTLFSKVGAGGNAALSLALMMPLKERNVVNVDGTLSFLGGSLSLDAFPMPLNRLLGDVRFDNQGVYGEAISAELQRYPITFDIDTEQTADGGQVQFVGRGKLGPRILTEGFGWSWARIFQGESEWAATITRPPGDAPLRIALQSSLQGTQVDLPPPLAKPAEQTSEIRVLGELSPAAPGQWQVDWGDRRRMRFEAGSRVPLRGELSLGLGAPLLPDVGLRVRGLLDRASVSEWQAWLGRQQGAGPTTNQPAPSWPELAVDLQIGVVDLFGRRIPDMSLALRRDANAWHAELAANAIDGDVYWPHRAGATNPAIINIASLSLPPAPAAEHQRDADRPAGVSAWYRVAPENIPHVSVFCGDCALANLATSQVAFKLRPDGKALAVEDFQWATAGGRLEGSGRWERLAPMMHAAAVNLNVTGKDAGRLLSDFHFSESVRGGEASAQFALMWDSPLLDVDMKTLRGTMEFTIKNGQLMDVDPGAGRVFSLISVNALPRRLSLDFSDVFSQGLVFDSLRGAFQVEQGIAQIDQLELLSSAAEASVTGNVDLVNKTYDQELLVSPDLSAGLTLAGALAGGPGLGAAMYLMQQIVKPKLAQIKYRVTGPWNAPKMERMTAVTSPPAAEFGVP